VGVRPQTPRYPLGAQWGLGPSSYELRGRKATMPRAYGLVHRGLSTPWSADPMLPGQAPLHYLCIDAQHVHAQVVQNIGP
jgi:hypothetical protein